MGLKNVVPHDTRDLIYRDLRAEEVLKNVYESGKGYIVPVAISARHIHLSQEDLETLFGEGYQLQKFKDLSQPGQFAAKETITIVGPKDVIKNVRALGPVRGETQIEISETDGYHLGVKPPVRQSGNIEGTPGITMVGPIGSVTLKQGVIVAATHIHLHTQDAKVFGISNGDYLQVEVDGERDLIFTNVLARVSEEFALEMHIDTDEANAAVVKSGDNVKIIAICPKH